MAAAVLLLAVALIARLLNGGAWTRLGAKDLRRISRDAEHEYREQIHPFE
ncbi:MAG TPA: hypothetical protein VMU19_14615 [Bryobacteraceae bacterium]|nr:hypothetical protein [Bryobacteraceae bacterium]